MFVSGELDGASVVPDGATLEIELHVRRTGPHIARETDIFIGDPRRQTRGTTFQHAPHNSNVDNISELQLCIYCISHLGARSEHNYVSDAELLLLIEFHRQVDALGFVVDIGDRRRHKVDVPMRSVQYLQRFDALTHLRSVEQVALI